MDAVDQTCHQFQPIAPFKISFDFGYIMQELNDMGPYYEWRPPVLEQTHRTDRPMVIKDMSDIQNVQARVRQRILSNQQDCALRTSQSLFIGI
jgi:hypothetical protein